jgi:hypothetical protein
LACFLIVAVLPLVLQSQVVEFSSNGLTYQALTRDGLTIMYARMPVVIREYGVIQVAVSNGGSAIRQIKATDFVFRPASGGAIRAASESEVIGDLFRNAGYNEVIKLQQAYEQVLYGNQRIRSNNGYEARRLSAIAFGNKGLKAAAAASAIAFVASELSSGDSTDGAVFFPNRGAELGPGSVVVVIDGQEFEFRAL